MKSLKALRDWVVNCASAMRCKGRSSIGRTVSVLTITVLVVVFTAQWISQRCYLQKELTSAIVSNDTAAVEDVLRNGADANSVVSDKAHSICDLLTASLTHSRANRLLPADCTSPLLCALEEDAKYEGFLPLYPPENTKIVDLLLKGGAYVDVQDHKGRTRSCWQPSRKRHTVALLLHYQPNLGIKDSSGRTLLQLLDDSDTADRALKAVLRAHHD